MLSFYAPTPQEFPLGYEHKFSAFGMGPEKAKDLARKLNLTNPKGWIVVAGCAGGLNPSFKCGSAYLVRSVKAIDQEWRMNIPKPLESFPQATLSSVKSPLWNSEEKIAFHHETGTDLVDCEMEWLLRELNEHLHPQLLFIRTVIDTSSQSIGFFNGYKMVPKKIFHPVEFFRFIRFVWSFFIFKKRHSDFFRRVDRVIFLDESTGIHQG